MIFEKAVAVFFSSGIESINTKWRIPRMVTNFHPTSNLPDDDTIKSFIKVVSQSNARYINDQNIYLRALTKDQPLVLYSEMSVSNATQTSFSVCKSSSRARIFNCKKAIYQYTVKHSVL